MLVSVACKKDYPAQEHVKLELLWEVPRSKQSKPGGREIAPIIYNEYIFTTFRRTLYARNKNSGELIWQKNTENSGWSHKNNYHTFNNQIALCGDQELLLVNPDNGESQILGSVDPDLNTITGIGKYVFQTRNDTRNVGDYKSHLVRYDLENLQSDTIFTVEVGDEHNRKLYSPLVHLSKNGDTLLIFQELMNHSNQLTSRYYCLLLGSNSPLWTASVEPARGGSAFIPMRPLIHDEKLYTHDEGILTCLELATGKRIWSVELDFEHSWSRQNFINEDKLFVTTRSDGNLAFSLATGDKIWHTRSWQHSDRFAFVDGFLIGPWRNLGELSQQNATTGSILDAKSTKLDGTMIESIATDSNLIFVETQKSLFCFRASKVQY